MMGHMTMTYVAFLRGINVGRAKQVAMAELGEIVEGLGHEDVRTLGRSGNVVFRGAEGRTAAIGTALEEAIGARLGMTVGVVIRTADELDSAIADNPIPDAEGEGAALHVMFLKTAPTAAERAAVDALDPSPDTIRIAGREIYVWYRQGMSGSTTAQQLDKRLKTLATDRNWNTIRKVAAMSHGDPARD
jgi:uncharacterized protein (DUF1697 family)